MQWLGMQDNPKSNPKSSYRGGADHIDDGLDENWMRLFRAVYAKAFTDYIALSNSAECGGYIEMMLIEAGARPSSKPPGWAWRSKRKGVQVDLVWWARRRRSILREWLDHAAVRDLGYALGLAHYWRILEGPCDLTWLRVRRVRGEDLDRALRNVRHCGKYGKIALGSAGGP